MMNRKNYTLLLQKKEQPTKNEKIEDISKKLEILSKDNDKNNNLMDYLLNSTSTKTILNTEATNENITIINRKIGNKIIANKRINKIENTSNTETAQTAQTGENSENTENTENAETTQTTENAENVENTQTTENAEHVETTQTTENVETTQTTENAETTQTTENVETTQTTQTTENAENAETTQNTENAESNNFIEQTNNLIMEKILKIIDDKYELIRINKLKELEEIQTQFLINIENNKILLKNSIVSKIEKTKIPLVIYQTWITKNLPEKMTIARNKLITNNFEFEFKLFDDIDCRNFIIKHFNNDVVYAYDNLIPGAYKADLWRYCILYIYGGIYIDIKYEPSSNFKFIDIIDKDYFVLDRNMFNGSIAIYNGLIITKPKNVIFLKLINKIIENVKNKYYGKNPFSITGPILMGQMLYNINEKYSKTLENTFDLLFFNYNIEFKKKIILIEYSDYRKEISKYSKNYYIDLWNKKKIFKN